MSSVTSLLKRKKTPQQAMTLQVNIKTQATISNNSSSKYQKHRPHQAITLLRNIKTTGHNKQCLYWKI